MALLLRSLYALTANSGSTGVLLLHVHLSPSARERIPKSAASRRGGSFASTSSRTASSLTRGCSPCTRRRRKLAWGVPDAGAARDSLDLITENGFGGVLAGPRAGQ